MGFPLLLLPKSDGSLRFYVDYRRPNAVNITDSYPHSRMDDYIDSLVETAVLTTLDYKSGYWQAADAEIDKDKTKFSSQMGTSGFNRMPLGLLNAPATFQRSLYIISSGVQWRSCLVYLRDAITNAQSRIRASKERYKKDFDWSFKEINKSRSIGNFLYLDIRDCHIGNLSIRLKNHMRSSQQMVTPLTYIESESLSALNLI